MGLFTRARWPVVLPLYDVRECPDCGALVRGDKGQRLHFAAMHEEIDYEEEAGPLDGYVIGNGPLPAELTGGEA